LKFQKNHVEPEDPLDPDELMNLKFRLNRMILRNQKFRLTQKIQKNQTSLRIH
jgi:hypothetical protein